MNSQYQKNESPILDARYTSFVLCYHLYCLLVLILAPVCLTWKQVYVQLQNDIKVVRTLNLRV